MSIAITNDARVRRHEFERIYLRIAFAFPLQVWKFEAEMKHVGDEAEHHRYHAAALAPRRMQRIENAPMNTAVASTGPLSMVLVRSAASMVLTFLVTVALEITAYDWCRQ